MTLISLAQSRGGTPALRPQVSLKPRVTEHRTTEEDQAGGSFQALSGQNSQAPLARNGIPEPGIWEF